MTGFVFRANNGEWYAVNTEGEQSPSFRTEREAAAYLSSPRCLISTAIAGEGL